MDRPAIYIRLPAKLNDSLRSHSESLGLTRQGYIRALLEASLSGATQRRDVSV